MKIVALFVLLLFSTSILAEIPSSTEIKKVLTYKEEGVTPILYDAVLTSEVKEMEPVDNISTIMEGSKASIWLKFFVPNEAENTDFTVVIKRGPVAIKTKQVTLKNANKSGAYRYRSWLSVPSSKAGDYSIEIYYQDKVVKNMTFTIKNS